MHLMKVPLLYIFGLSLLKADDQNYFISFEDPLLGVYYPNDSIQCNARQWFTRRKNVSSIYIVIRQILRDNTKVKLATCPFQKDWITSECKANFSAYGCEDQVKISCAVETNQTETERTLEITIAGKPSRLLSFHTRYQRVENDHAMQTFPSGTLIELICEGEVPMINGKVFQNITLCENKDNHRSTELSLQDPAVYRTENISKDGCVGNQMASAFIHLDRTRLEREIICETGYIDSFANCGNGKYRKTIRIYTEEELHDIFGPFVVHKDVQGNKTLLSLTCDSTTETYHAETTEYIRWCIKTGNSKHFKILPLQEQPNEEMFNSSLGMKFRSSVLYQLSDNLKNVEIICETNFSKECGSGTVRGRVFLNNDTNSYKWENDSDQRPTQFYVGIGMIIGGTLVLSTALIIIGKTWKRGGKEGQRRENFILIEEPYGGTCPVSAENQVLMKTCSRRSVIPMRQINQRRSQEQSTEEEMVKTDENPAVIINARVQGELTDSHVLTDIYEPMNHNKVDEHVYEKQHAGCDETKREANE